MKYGIDPICEEYLGSVKIPTTDLLGTKKNQISMTEVAIDKLTEYACEDADCCWRLYELFSPMITHKKLGEFTKILNVHLYLF